MTALFNLSMKQNICFVGFGEAGEALSGGFVSQDPLAWDSKLDQNEPTCRDRITRARFIPASSLTDALTDVDWVVSLVTADQAIACEQVCNY